MYQYVASGREWKVFVRERTPSPESRVEKNLSKGSSDVSISGEKAREFYENLLNESASCEVKTVVHATTQNTKKNKNISGKKSSASGKIFKNSDLLQMAQNNDVKNLEIFFSQSNNYDIDIVDDFGWTPLMCAACSGAEDAVKILLEKKADPRIYDKSGNTALKLAIKNNWVNIRNMLIESINKTEINVEDEGSSEAPEPFFCEICKENFVTIKKKHDSSTLHLFNCKIKTSTFYGIPECNKGFQLLLKEGWNKEKGLGPKGSGRKFPIKAIMKKDRKGIGAPYEPEQSVNKKSESLSKYENNKIRNYNKWKEKNFERNFRLQFC